MAKSIKELQKIIYKVEEDIGNHGEVRTVGDLIALCHSNLSDALSWYNQHREIDFYYSGEEYKNDYSQFEIILMHKPEGFIVELAKCIINIMDICEHYNLNLEHAIEAQIKYNYREHQQ